MHKKKKCESLEIWENNYKFIHSSVLFIEKNNSIDRSINCVSEWTLWTSENAGSCHRLNYDWCAFPSKSWGVRCQHARRQHLLASTKWRSHLPIRRTQLCVDPDWFKAKIPQKKKLIIQTSHPKITFSYSCDGTWVTSSDCVVNTFIISPEFHEFIFTSWHEMFSLSIKVS